MSKHTPGPWAFTPAGCFVDGNGSPTTTPTEFQVSPIMCRLSVGNVSASRREADARLIAAAPDLLLALAWLHSLSTAEGVRRRDLSEQLRLAMSAASSALNKATGEQT